MLRSSTLLVVSCSVVLADAWQGPQMVDNPFFMTEQAAADRTSSPAESNATATVGVSIAGGEMVGEAPVFYRLPPVRVADRVTAVERPRSGEAEPKVAAYRLPRPAADAVMPPPRAATPVSASAGDTLPFDRQPKQQPMPVDREPHRDEQFAADELADSFRTAEFNPDAALPYAPTSSELSRQLLPAIRKAYGLARRGAIYAARAEFVQILRRIAQAKDAAGSDARSQALAAGLRAIDEADDFIPEGTALEAEVNVAQIASSHRTPLLAGRAATIRPHEALTMYHQFAENQLGRAGSGERAGAMALYGLGKIHKRLAQQADGDLVHQRKAMTMFLASLAAAPDNHLAANEVGVLLARGGHHEDAAERFRQAIDIAPSSTTYHNLAVVEQKLGLHAQAAANERYAQHLAARDREAGAVSRRMGIAWVAPDDMAQMAPPQPMPRHHAYTAQRSVPPSRPQVLQPFRR